MNAERLTRRASRLLAGTALAIAVGTATHAQSAPRIIELDRIVAVVNDDVIVQSELDARVVQLEPRPVVQLVETLREQPMPSLASAVELGQRIRVRVERVNPRAGVVALRRVD